MGLWCSPMTAVGWTVMIAAWAAVVGLAVWAVCRLFPVQRTPDPRAALDARLAAGDIDRDGRLIDARPSTAEESEGMRRPRSGDGGI